MFPCGIVGGNIVVDEGIVASALRGKIAGGGGISGGGGIIGDGGDGGCIARGGVVAAVGCGGIGDGVI